MHTSVHTDRNAWRVPPDETLQVADPKTKKGEVGSEEVSTPEELAYDPSEGHNWWSIILSLLVIGMVIAGIVAAILLLGYVDELLYWHGKRMNLDEYLEGPLNPRRLPHSWISETYFVFQSDDGGLAILDTRNFTVSLLVTNHTLRHLNVKGYQCSSDLKYVLLKHNVKTVFRQSFTAHYTVYDVNNDHHIPVRLAGASKAQPQRLQHVSWLGNTTALLIIFGNDIYFRKSPSDLTDTRLTFTGVPDVIYNGLPDWLYQEDVLKKPEVLWASFDGSHLLYATFNDSAVRTLIYPWFTSGTILAAGGAVSSAPTFPPYRSVRFPTPGTQNPTVQLWVLDISNLTDLRRWQIIPPQALLNQDYYLTSAGWIGQGNTQVSAVWMNRAQNLSIISACNAPNWTCIEKYTERAAEEAWLEIQEHPIFAPDGNSFLLLAPVQEGNTDTFTHIKHVSLIQQRISVLSHGRMEVTEILAWDSFNNTLYYLGTHENRPGQRHLYVMKNPTTDEDIRRIAPECITCDLGKFLWSSRYYYTNCTHFGASISPSSIHSGILYYVLLCEGPGFPLAGVHSTKTHKLLRVLYDTRPQQEPILSQFALPKQRSFVVRLSQGIRAQVQLLLPPSWRPELRDAAYPVLVEVNGRPGSRAVTEKFSVDFGTYMSSHCDVVYVRLDVRGSSGQSNHALYRHLGGIEVEDQVHVLKYLLEKNNFLDETRVGLWGWGYGGYVTSMVLGSQQKIFKCGVAVSPIADWLYYNSAFTERVLGLPSENYKAYVEADSTQQAKNIPSKSIFLIHGLADITTPYIHGISLARALTEAGVLFRYKSYADEGHDLVGVIGHVYKSMEDFFQECLSLDTEDPKAAPDT